MRRHEQRTDRNCLVQKDTLSDFVSPAIRDKGSLVSHSANPVKQDIPHFCDAASDDDPVGSQQCQCIHNENSLTPLSFYFAIVMNLSKT